ncbi:MAG: hypothetical protein AABX12_00975 [Nanoarchaeota archaeon]
MKLNAIYSVRDKGELEKLMSAIDRFEESVEIQPHSGNFSVGFIPSSDVVSVKPVDEDIKGVYLIRQCQPEEGPIRAYISEAAPNSARVIIGEWNYRVNFRREGATREVL